MDAGDLRVFEAVARHGVMNRAAAELNTVQSNVTARIRALETALGAALFRRHSRGVALTEAGARLLPYAARVRHLLEEARRAVADDGTPAGPLTIGALESTAAFRLSPLLARFAAAHSRVDLVLRTGTTAEMTEAVLDRRVEGAFVCGPVRHPELTAETLFHEELALATAPSLRAPEALARLPAVRMVVLRAGCSYRQRLEEVLARRGVVAPRVLEFGTLDAIVGCVAAGIGVTLLPRGLLAPARRDGRVALHALAPEESRVETLFLRRADAPVTSALAAFLETARAALGPDAAAA